MPRLQQYLVEGAAKAFSQRKKVAGRHRSVAAENALKSAYSWAGTQDLLMREIVRTGRTPEECARVLLVPQACERYARELLALHAIAHRWTPTLVTLHDVAAVFRRATPVQGSADERQLAILDGACGIDDVADALYQQRAQLDDEIAIVDRFRAQRHLPRPTRGTAPAPRRERTLAVAHGGRGD